MNQNLNGVAAAASASNLEVDRIYDTYMTISNALGVKFASEFEPDKAFQATYVGRALGIPMT